MSAKQRLKADAIPDVIKRVAQDGNHPDSRVVRIVARSPGAAAAREVMSNLAELHRQGVDVQAVFLNIPEKGPGSAMLRRFVELFGAQKLSESVRIAGFPGSGELLEQITFGRVGVWTGKPIKAMRTSTPEDGAYAETEDNQKLAKMARAAFVSTWAVSQRMSKRDLKRAGIDDGKARGPSRSSKRT
jgi:hypothetical protein